jgi:hypothetical protein
MSANVGQTLLTAAAARLGLAANSAQNAYAIEQARFKQAQSEANYRHSQLTRQAAYVGVGLTAFSLVALTAYLLRRTIATANVDA